MILLSGTWVLTPELPVITTLEPIRRWSATAALPPSTTRSPITVEPPIAAWPQSRQVAADPHVVADLHLVVDLGAVADGGVGDRAAVDAAVGADLHVVADHHRAERVDADVLLLLAGGDDPGARASSTIPGVGVTKEKPSAPITAPGWAMKRSPMRTRAPIRTPFRISASRPIAASSAIETWLKMRAPGADPHARADDDERPDGRARADLGARIDRPRSDGCPRAISGGRSKTRLTPAST